MESAPEQETCVIHVAGHLYSKRDRERLHEQLNHEIGVPGTRHVVVDFSEA